jgi:hypothetical protein
MAPGPFSRSLEFLTILLASPVASAPGSPEFCETLLAPPSPEGPKVSVSLEIRKRLMRDCRVVIIVRSRKAGWVRL